MSRAFISLGSNLGDRKKILELSLVELGKLFELKVVSSLFESEPWGYKEQNDFLNAVVEIEVAVSPHELLRLLKNIERDFGRESGGLRMGPRALDLDILLYGSNVIDGHDLKIPHPGLKKRFFQLLPLLELAPSVKDPLNGKNFKAELENIGKDTSIKKIAVFNKDNLCWDEDIQNSKIITE
ncbi:MAG: 2-amino-4-hydroxy-6-hydroxymethyldihydropteridine diphosphokinase [Candidatus Kaelpia imicola]|nr:2-amino-4-hydroxy-6-hydroxymethyldihydropteridine diphosphokinase [Candidatus Kaelpia imicola]